MAMIYEAKGRSIDGVALIVHVNADDRDDAKWQLGHVAYGKADSGAEVQIGAIDFRTVRAVLPNDRLSGSSKNG
jgi:hypothetical protein